MTVYVTNEREQLTTVKLDITDFLALTEGPTMPFIVHITAQWHILGKTGASCIEGQGVT